MPGIGVSKSIMDRMNRICWMGRRRILAAWRESGDWAGKGNVVTQRRKDSKGRLGPFIKKADLLQGRVGDTDEVGRRILDGHMVFV